jgi:hypothetical protein
MTIGAVYKLNIPNVSLRIHSTGSLNLTAKKVESLDVAVRHVLPKLLEFRDPRLPKSIDEVIHTIK